jgi:hypothetical protein
MLRRVCAGCGVACIVFSVELLFFKKAGEGEERDSGGNFRIFG